VPPYSIPDTPATGYDIHLVEGDSECSVFGNESDTNSDVAFIVNVTSSGLTRCAAA